MIYDYPQDIVYEGNKAAYNNRPAILWGVGMMLAFYARWDNTPLRAQRTFDAIQRDYGPFPKLRLWPESFSKDSVFYARYAAHVLFGLAILSFGKR